LPCTAIVPRKGLGRSEISLAHHRVLFFDQLPEFRGIM
jgi:predicted ATPase with chaperone activity